MEISFYKHVKYHNSILVRDFDGNVNVETLINSLDDLFKSDLQMDFNSFETLLNYFKSQDFIKKLKLEVI